MKSLLLIELFSSFSSSAELLGGLPVGVLHVGLPLLEHLLECLQLHLVIVLARRGFCPISLLQVVHALPRPFLLLLETLHHDPLRCGNGLLLAVQDHLGLLMPLLPYHVPPLLLLPEIVLCLLELVVQLLHARLCVLHALLSSLRQVLILLLHPLFLLLSLLLVLQPLFLLLLRQALSHLLLLLDGLLRSLELGLLLCDHVLEIECGLIPQRLQRALGFGVPGTQSLPRLYGGGDDIGR
mmetsp:Transcript_94708/g.203377  ORF Transcript_94708/g.203377 Transcript_94708/m.203377 type:complete len:239 (-) Transcript_94708:365-1081(-)